MVVEDRVAARAAHTAMLAESASARAAENSALLMLISSALAERATDRTAQSRGPSLRASPLAVAPTPGGGGGGDGGSPESVSHGSASPKRSPGSDSPLLAAVAAATPPFVPLSIAVGTGSRLLPAATQQRLFLHRLHTVWNLGEFDCTAISSSDHLILPTPGKGLSMFAIVCEEPAAVAAALALRAGITKKHNGCSMRRLDELPGQHVATFDRVLHTLPGPGGGPIVWHVTLTPLDAMEQSAFRAAFEGWSARPCDLKAAADVLPAYAALPEHDCSAEELRIFTPRCLGYAAQKLAAAAEQRGEGQLQAAGGSPG